jgi:cytochrome P450
VSSNVSETLPTASHLSVPKAYIFGADAQAVWQEMGRSKSPFLDAEIVDGSTYVVGAEAVQHIMKHPEVFSSGPKAAFLGAEDGMIPIQIDRPAHLTYRRVLDPIFSPRRMAARADMVAAYTNECIDLFIESGKANITTDIAEKVPPGVFLAMLGLPLTHLPEFVPVKDALVRPPGDTDEEQNAAKAAAAQWVYGFFGEALDERLANPSDDLIGEFAALEVAGVLTRAENLNILLLLLPAGLDTLAASLCSFFAFLSTHPEHQRQLAEDPSLVPSAVEELLRYEAPSPVTARFTLEDTVVAGHPLAKDTRLRVVNATYNLDPEVFPDPLTVDFHRKDIHHWSFGAGIHRCLGSHLARLELRTVLREWHRRIPSYQLKEGAVLQYRVMQREIVELPLEFTPGRREG